MLQRHALNLISLCICGFFVLEIWWNCSQILFVFVFLNCLCGLIFHGAHCVGYQKWADNIFMKYDTISVIATALILIIYSHNRITCCFCSLSLFLLWVLTFSVLKELPFNIIQSLLHILGSMIHHIVAKDVCNA